MVDIAWDTRGVARFMKLAVIAGLTLCVGQNWTEPEQGYTLGQNDLQKGVWMLFEN